MAQIKRVSKTRSETTTKEGAYRRDSEVLGNSGCTKMYKVHSTFAQSDPSCD